MVAFSSILVAGTLVVSTIAAPLHFSEFGRRALPVGISASTAKTYLSQLTVEEPSNSPAYKRDYFHTWIIISGQCNTRETVLKRDGTNVVTNSKCTAVSGNWVSPYDDVSATSASDIDIDHMVPLKEAWISGARDWTAARREQFANDITRPQLAAVTHTINEDKSDKDPASWLPPNDSFKCTYVTAYIQVKQYYDLSIDPDEKNALADALDKHC